MPEFAIALGYFVQDLELQFQSVRSEKLVEMAMSLQKPERKRDMGSMTRVVLVTLDRLRLFIRGSLVNAILFNKRFMFPAICLRIIRLDSVAHEAAF
jgi:hypothetical protein